MRAIARIHQPLRDQRLRVASTLKTLTHRVLRAAGRRDRADAGGEQVFRRLLRLRATHGGLTKLPEPPPPPLTLGTYIKRRLALGFMTTISLVTGLGLASAVVVYVWRQQVYPELFALQALIFLLGSAAGVWYISRLVTTPLQALGRLEKALQESAQAGTAGLTLLPLPANASYRSVFQAYDTLIARLEESEARRMEFLASIVHELRSPLASILGYAAILTDPPTPLTEAEAANHAQIIVTQALRMSRLVEEVLTAAQMEAEHLEIFPARLRLAPFLEEITGEVRQQSQREIIFDKNGLDELCSEGDALRLREVFLNLIENALKFSPPETPVSVTLRHGGSRRQIEIIVADQGVGIAEHELPKLFRPFGRIKNDRTRGIQGSGLGLYIVKQIVERHHGTIAVRSKPEQGTAFIVTLPLEQTPPRA
jgi:signal transduction histidine kinase